MEIRERRKRIYRKRIPYGMQNFEDVIKEDCFYVDKTPFIEDIEESNKYFFYIRPRRLAYDGDFKPYFDYIADCLKRYSSQRDKQKGEAYVHGFTLAMTSQCKFYRPISELDNDGGYADIFLLPLCDIYKSMEDSYIVELKYCKSSTTDEQVKLLFKEASAQICRYADSDIVRESIKTTKLHKLVVIYRGAEMVACEEAEE